MSATGAPLGISHCAGFCGSYMPQQGRTVDCFSPLANFIPHSGSMKVISNLNFLIPMAKEYGFLSNKALPLTSEKQPKAMAIANII